MEVGKHHCNPTAAFDRLHQAGVHVFEVQLCAQHRSHGTHDCNPTSAFDWLHQAGVHVFVSPTAPLTPLPCGGCNHAFQVPLWDSSMLTVLSAKLDFKNVDPSLVEPVKRCGGVAVMLPKFHCEIHPIELAWGRSKHSARKNCRHTIQCGPTLLRATRWPTTG